MSESWDELRNKKDFRLEIEKYWSRADGELSARMQHGGVIVKPEAYIKKLHSVDLDIASIREGLMAIEDRLTRIETRLDELEGTGELDEHR